MLSMPFNSASHMLCISLSIVAVDLPLPGDILRVPTHLLNSEISFTAVLDVDIAMILESSFCRTLLCFSLKWEEYVGLLLHDKLCRGPSSNVTVILNASGSLWKEFSALLIRLAQVPFIGVVQLSFWSFYLLSIPICGLYVAKYLALVTGMFTTVSLLPLFISFAHIWRQGLRQDLYYTHRR